MRWNTLTIDIADHVAQVRLNRPDKANAMSRELWSELPQAMAWLDEQVEAAGARVAVLAGNGKHFCAGIDVQLLAEVGTQAGAKGCAARTREQLRKFILGAQDSLTSVERLRIPVIAAVHGACYGAGVDLIAACDLRYASADAKFCIKEVDLALAADVGTLQRLQHAVPLHVLAELSYTAETFDGARAAQLGLLNRCYGSADELHAGVLATAKTIAAKSPVAVRGIKHNLLYSRDHTVAEGLHYMAAWNAAMLISDDAPEALMAAAQKRPAKFK